MNLIFILWFIARLPNWLEAPFWIQIWNGICEITGISLHEHSIYEFLLQQNALTCTCFSLNKLHFCCNEKLMIVRRDFFLWRWRNMYTTHQKSRHPHSDSSPTFPLCLHASMWSYRMSCAFDAHILSINICYLCPSWLPNKWQWL
jgi:hypothetical protein